MLPAPIAHIVSDTELIKTRVRAINVLTIDTSLILLLLKDRINIWLKYLSKKSRRAVEPTNTQGIEP